MNLSYRNQKNAVAVSQYWGKSLDKPDWYKIEAKSDGEVELFIYDIIGWPYNDPGEILRAMSDMKDTHILARINSPGGDVWDGMALVNGFMNHPGGVTGRIEGLAASMAAGLAMGCKKLQAYPNSMMMIHNSWVCAVGNRLDLLSAAEVLEKIDENQVELFANKTKLGKKEIREMMVAETYMNAKEMKAKGFIDEILSGKGAKAQFDLSIFANCPECLKGDEIINTITEKDLEKAMRDVYGLSHKEAKTALALCRKSKGIDEAEAAKQAETKELFASIQKGISILKQ